MSPSFVVWSIVAPFAVITVGTGPQSGPSDSGPGTALELALADRTCRGGVYATDPEAHDQCISAEIAALRADFGRDLQRLSLGERKAFDRACGRLNNAVTRESYVDCLNGQIVARRKRLEKSNGEAQVAESAVPPPQTAEPRSANTSVWRWVMLAGGIGVLAAAAGVVAVVRRRPSRRICDACKQPVSDATALCADCRRAAADALRCANEERAAAQSAQEALRREQEQREEEQRRMAAQLEEAERRREAEEARRMEEEETLRRAQADAARRTRDLAPEEPVETVFDPYAVLGVPCEADGNCIRAAYEAARSKYQPDIVAHLGFDVQEHYRTKAEAVARAYEMLTAARA